MASHPRIASRERSLLLVVDLQEAFRGKLHEEERVVATTQKLLRAASLLKIPIVVTEQYPKGLGNTLPEIESQLPRDAARFEKTAFSCCGAPGLLDALRESKRDQIVIAGVETHICVSQTAHELLAEDFQPHLVREAISSRTALNADIGFAKMVGSGAVPTTLEQILFEWLRDARAPEFKEIQRMIL